MSKLIIPLTLQEPLIKIELYPATAFSRVLQESGEQVPKSILINGLIDTGFTGGLAIDSELIKNWGLRTRNFNEVSLPRDHGPQFFRSYAWEADVAVKFFDVAKGGGNIKLDPIAATFLDLAPGQGFQAIIGQEILQTTVFVYNGPKNCFTLEFSRKYAEAKA